MRPLHTGHLPAFDSSPEEEEGSQAKRYCHGGRLGARPLLIDIGPCRRCLPRMLPRLLPPRAGSRASEVVEFGAAGNIGPRAFLYRQARAIQTPTERAMRAAVLVVAVLALIAFRRADASGAASFSGVGTRWAFQAITEWSFAYELIRPQARYRSSERIGTDRM